MRLPTSWELCRPVGAPAYGYVLSATLLSGPSPIRGCLVPSNSAAAKAIGLSVLGPARGKRVAVLPRSSSGRHQISVHGCASSCRAAGTAPCGRRRGPRGEGGVWTHSSAANRRVSRGQPKDRNSEGGAYAAGPDVRRSLSKRSGRRCCAETGCRVPTGRAATRGRGSLPSLGLPSGLRTVATVHAVREFDCLDASSLRPCSSNAAHTRAGKGRFDARPGNCKSVPVRGSDGPDQPAVVSATATRRHVPPRSRSERTSRRAVGGRRASGAADNWLSRAPHFSRLLPST